MAGGKSSGFRNFVRIVSEQDTRNLKNAGELDLRNTGSVRSLAQLTSKEFESGKLVFLGPTPTGNTIVRFTAIQRGNAKMLKSHFELSMSPAEAMEWAMKDVAFYKGLWSTKFAQFIGYRAEKILMDVATMLDKNAYRKVNGKKVAEYFNKKFVEGRVFALQTADGHGIDLFGEIANPPPKWGTIDSKGTMKETFEDYATPRGPGLSEAQLEGGENLILHVEKALLNVSNGNPYNLTPEQVKILKQFSDDYKIDTSCVQAYVATLGLKNGFQRATNTKYPGGMIIIAKLEEVILSETRALASEARRARRKANKAVEDAKVAVEDARRKADEAKEIEDINKARREALQKEGEYRKAQRRVEKAAETVKRLEDKVESLKRQPSKP